MSKINNGTYMSKYRLKKTNRNLINRSNNQKNVDDMDNPSEEQWRGIKEAIKEIDSGKMITNEVVMAEICKKYLNA